MYGQMGPISDAWQWAWQSGLLNVLLMLFVLVLLLTTVALVIGTEGTGTGGRTP